MPLSHAKLWKAVDALARRQGLSPSGLARRAGLDPTSFNPSKRFGSGEPPRPRWPSTESVARILDVTGMSLADFARLADNVRTEPEVIPLLGLAQAGEDGFFDDAGLPMGEGWEQTELPQGEGLFSLRITGDSMIPLYREGDRVILGADATDVRRGDRVVARTRSGETLAKEVAALTAKAVVLTSINPAYADRIVPRKDLLWIRRILWVSQ